jgi:hypothetical protein
MVAHLLNTSSYEVEERGSRFKAGPGKKHEAYLKNKLKAKELLVELK